MKNMDTKNKIKNLNAQEIKRKTLTQSPVRRDIVHHIVFRVEKGSLVDPHFTRTQLPDFSK